MLATAVETTMGGALGLFIFVTLVGLVTYWLGRHDAVRNAKNTLSDGRSEMTRLIDEAERRLRSEMWRR